jgi:hypothetical protein
MNGISLLLVWASLGVVYSWRAGVDGQQEYVLQVEPEILQSLTTGEEAYISSDVPAEAGQVQRLCIVVLPKGGTAAVHTQLAEDRFRQLALAAGRYASNDPALASDSQPTILWPSRANPEQTYGISTGWQPDAKGSLQYFVQIDSTVLRTLAIGDELYIPVDPSAGKPARFIVKSGKAQLPRITAPQTQLTQGGAPLSPFSSGSSRGRFPGASTGASVPGVSDGATNAWSNSPTTPTGGLTNDYARQTRPNATYPNTTNPSATDPRSNSLWNSGGNTYGPASGTTLNPPANSWGDFAAGNSQSNLYPANTPPFSDGRSFGSAPPATSSHFDRYKNPNTAAYDQANSAHYPPPANGQQMTTPQISRGNVQQPFDTRLAGGSGVPNGTNVLGAAGMMPPDAQVAKKEQSLGAFFFVMVALFFSIGGNLYLAYTALEFHSRYRNAIERLRSAARSA